jgi:hypothetical protein
MVPMSSARLIPLLFASVSEAREMGTALNVTSSPHLLLANSTVKLSFA